VNLVVGPLTALHTPYVRHLLVNNVFVKDHTCTFQSRYKGRPTGDVMASSSSIASDKDDGDWVEDAAADFDFVRFTMSDINGVPRSKLIPRRQVNEKLKTGAGICSGEIHHILICIIIYHLI